MSLLLGVSLCADTPSSSLLASGHLALATQARKVMKGALKVDQSLDIRGLPAPEGYHAAVDRLHTMAENDVLELSIDEGKALETIPFGLRAEGHEILISEPAPKGVRLLIKKRNLLT